MQDIPETFEQAEAIDVATLPDATHPQAVVMMQDAADRGWRMSQRHPRKGFRIWCPCPEEGKTHQAWIVPNPESESYFEKTRQRMIRMTCWEESE